MESDAETQREWDEIRQMVAAFSEKRKVAVVCASSLGFEGTCNVSEDTRARLTEDLKKGDNALNRGALLHVPPERDSMENLRYKIASLVGNKHSRCKLGYEIGKEYFQQKQICRGKLPTLVESHWNPVSFAIQQKDVPKPKTVERKQNTRPDTRPPWRF